MLRRRIILMASWLIDASFLRSRFCHLIDGDVEAGVTRSVGTKNVWMIESRP